MEDFPESEYELKISESDTFTAEELIEACRVSGVNIKTDEQPEALEGNSALPRGAQIQFLADGPHLQDAVDPETANIQVASSSATRMKRKGKAYWTCEVQKRKRVSGESYLGYKTCGQHQEQKRILSTVKPARKMGPTCTSRNCKRTKLRTCSKFPDNVREHLFQDFWKGSQTWDEKRAYVNSLVDKIKPKYPRKSGDSRKVDTYVYYLKLNGEKQKVCRQMFMNTLGLQSKQLRGWLKNSGSTQRSQTAPKVVLEKENDARKFMETLPKLPSHYCRSSTEKMYLEPLFKNKSHVYKEYLKWCENFQINFVSWPKFHSLIDEMKIGIYQPKKDRCDICCGHEAKNISPEIFQTHQMKKEAARAEKIEDKSQAMKNLCHVITMDLQGVKLAPSLNASALYYKTKICIHNFTLYDLSTRYVMCYLWDETEGELVASTFATCLLEYLETHFKDDLPIIIYSDGCTHQNRNAVLANALLDYSIRKNKIVIQKYLEKGHTQMEVDSVHSTIERQLKYQEIYLPTDYIQICLNARKTPNPYDVKYMRFYDFTNYLSKDLRYSSIRPGNKTGDPHVTDLRQLKYTPDGKVYYKLDHTSEWSEMPRKPRTIGGSSYSKLYANKLRISKRKFQDLQDLLTVIPTSAHAFYQTLSYSN